MEDSLGGPLLRVSGGSQASMGPWSREVRRSQQVFQPLPFPRLGSKAMGGREGWELKEGGGMNVTGTPS